MAIPSTSQVQPHIKPVLQSTTLSVFPTRDTVGRLAACLASDSAHIGRFSPPGNHIDTLQQALRLIAERKPLSLPPITDPPGTYGASTAAAVLKYKGQDHIVRIGQRLDDIIGRMTITQIDNDLLEIEKKAPSTLPPVPPQGQSNQVRIVAFTEPEPMLIAQRPHDLSKGDLDNTRRLPILNANDPRTAIAMAVVISDLAEPVALLEVRLLEEVVPLAGAIGFELVNDFKSNPTAKRVISKEPGNLISETVRASPEFAALNDEIRRFITAAIQDSVRLGNIVDYHVLALATGKVKTSKLAFGGLQTMAVLGNFQGTNVFLRNFSASAQSRTYTADLRYEFIDHFGVDDSDLIKDFGAHGTPGQIALWVMQHHKRPGHQPFVVNVVVDKTISDGF